MYRMGVKAPVGFYAALEMTHSRIPHGFAVQWKGSFGVMAQGAGTNGFFYSKPWRKAENRFRKRQSPVRSGS